MSFLYPLKTRTSVGERVVGIRIVHYVILFVRDVRVT